MRFFAFWGDMKNDINIETVLSNVSYELQKLFDSAPYNTFDYLDLVQLLILYRFEEFSKRLEQHTDLLESLLTRLKYANPHFNLDEVFEAERTARKVLGVFDSQYKFADTDELDFPLNIDKDNLERSYRKINRQLFDIHKEQLRISFNNEDVLKLQSEANQLVEELRVKKYLLNQDIDDKNNSLIKKLYDEIHEEEVSIANKYRNWALGIFAIIGTILMLGFLNISIQNWNHLRDSTYIHIPLGWESLIKTLMLFSLTTPAWYLARESSKHRKVAYKARMLGTELASFPLYAREFKDEDRLELRKHLADRFFGQELYNDSKADSNSDNSLEQVKLLTEANKVLAESFKMKKSVENS